MRTQRLDVYKEGSHTYEYVTCCAKHRDRAANCFRRSVRLRIAMAPTWLSPEATAPPVRICSAHTREGDTLSREVGLCEESTSSEKHDKCKCEGAFSNISGRRHSPGAASATRPCVPLNVPVAARLPPQAQPNGVELPSVWPPDDIEVAEFVNDPPRARRQPPYVLQPPQTIRIDVGRQLFVDDFLVENHTFQRRWHSATTHILGLLVPDQRWESGRGNRATARPFGGGSLLDPRTQELKLWYRCAWRGSTGKTCLAISHDGRTFTKPELRSAGSRRHNVVLESRFVEAFEVVYDAWSDPPRFVGLRMEWMTGGKRVNEYTVYDSPDGANWRKREDVHSGVMADRSTFFINPLRKRPHWIFSLRENLCEGGPSGHMRARRYWEIPHGSWLGERRCCSYQNFLRNYYQCEEHRAGEPVPWFAIDSSDCGFRQCDVYNVDGIAYESILLHGLAILWGPGCAPQATVSTTGQ